MRSLALTSFLCTATIAHAQVVSYQVVDPLQSVLSHLAGPNVIVTAAGIQNDPVLFATFIDSTASIGLDSGLVLVNGAHFVVMGPNNVPNASFGTFPGPFDQDLANLSVPYGPTLDVSRLDINLVPLGDTLSLRYVFGSEEYDEWVCSVKDDRIAFFLDGPGISGPFLGNAINIALLPSGLPVTVNTVNSGQPGINGNAGLCFLNVGWPQDTSYYINNDFGLGTQLDAYTTVLTARAVVVPGETYHLKIIIADLDDDNFDSAVFLEAGSLRCNELPTMLPEATGDGAPLIWADASGMFHVLNDGLAAPVRVRVFDPVGRLLVEDIAAQNGARWSLPLQDAKGTLLVEVSAGEERITGRIFMP
ncbi:MAG: choice-of-anchor L domain-containing protein [Flavobacteriales bacterium]|nr:choice-of-anchor L domain-containing protein [Flavobacteriales bacterium]